MNKKIDPAVLNFRKEALNVLNKVLYRRLDQEFLFREAAIIHENSRLLGNTQKCMRYKGELIGAHFYHQFAIPRPANSIQPPIIEKYEALVLESDQLMREERALVVGYIRKVLNLPVAFESLFHLFPEQLHQALAGLKPFCPFTNLKPMEADAQQAFIKEHEHYISLMQVRMLKNLINA